ncbi:hypothetical protein [Actinoplanes sp. NPDC051851]|uniref:hypothetical protein n=1 Tax=Actinoplanes sp. NPDC051851 TaxID=3154753 RepID=UPI00344637D0
MNEEEIARLLADLEQLMAELGLDFIVTQERVLGAEGVSLEFTGARGGGDIGERYLDQIMPREASPRARAVDERGAFRMENLGTPRFRKGDVALTPLDVRDRLAILLDLIEVATAGTLAMERDVSAQLEEFRQLSLAQHDSATVENLADVEWAQTWDGAVIFEDPPESEVRGAVAPPWKLPDEQLLQAQMSRARSVVELLDGLREAAGVSRGKWLAQYGKTANTGDVWNMTGQHS